MEDLLKEILVALKDNRLEKATMSIEEAARYSGIGREKLRELCEKEGTDFPYFRSGKKVRINKSLLDNWLDRLGKEHVTI